jgi:transcription antitermination factor NusG
MPILPAEPDLFPPELWQRDDPTDGGARAWWCLHTLPRQEKAIARDLRQHGIAYYLPQAVNEKRTPQGRKIRSVAPLFTGYVFLLGDQAERLSAIRSNRLVNVLEVADQAGLTRDLRQVHRLLNSGLTVLPEPQMPVGARVRITSGPLLGMEGTVVRRGKRDQFVAVVNFLGRGAMVELEDWQVERLDGPHAPLP